ncbi:hypothetical protein JYU34_003964 [Plutella xylostella]|uniref:Uncharacterized protein n=1 Tax=Plutella xylostella TaxID=51655 RepID=A0ABQ7R1B5_PLUXY|nr:hypothetical protein JYU34_003964 [Plutella xylostella]
MSIKQSLTSRHITRTNPRERCSAGLRVSYLCKRSFEDSEHILAAMTSPAATASQGLPTPAPPRRPAIPCFTGKDV